MASRHLSTTAISVLGLLGLRSMTGYEITQTAQRTYRYLWPREDSVLYDQPRRLEAGGLVTSSREKGARRPRTRYTITEEGREAIRTWLASPARPHFDWEPAVRLILADQGTHADLVATLSTVRDWALTGMREGLPIAESYLAGTSAFPERDSLNGINAVFVADLLLTVHEWSSTALAQVEQWSSPVDDAGHTGWRIMLGQRLRRVRQVLGAGEDVPDGD